MLWKGLADHYQSVQDKTSRTLGLAAHVVEAQVNGKAHLTHGMEGL
jgi:hypothetical protein